MLDKIKEFFKEFDISDMLIWLIPICIVIVLLLPGVDVEHTVELTYINGDRDTVVYIGGHDKPILQDGCYYKDSYRDSTRVRQPWGEPLACGVRKYVILNRREINQD